jgi:hypothetical protein
VEVEGRGVLVRGGMLGNGGVPTYCARRLRRSGVPPTEYGVPAGLPREPGPLRLLGVPTAAAEEMRGLTMLTGLVGLVIGKVMAE